MAASIDITSVEPSRAMGDIAAVILSGYQDAFEQKQSGDAKFSICERIGVQDFNTCAVVKARGNFDLILFSHAFKVYTDENEWTQERANVIEIASKHLAPCGKLVLLTPQRPAQKLQQKADLVNELSVAGLIHLSIPMNGEISAPIKRPQALTEIRQRFIDEGARLAVPHVFPDPAVSDNRPYYYCNCNVDVFIKPFAVSE